MDRTPSTLGRRADRYLAVLVAIALLAPTIGPGFGYELTGWLPDHSHASLGAVAQDHAHPWDASRPSDAVERSDGLGFTAGSMLGASVLPVLMLAGVSIPVLTGQVVTLRLSKPPPAPLFRPDPPPPR
ncbi:MAG: hypothetical protein WEB13_02705 [Dehalococcoidia bacterium]